MWFMWETVNIIALKNKISGVNSNCNFRYLMTNTNVHKYKKSFGIFTAACCQYINRAIRPRTRMKASYILSPAPIIDILLEFEFRTLDWNRSQRQDVIRLYFNRKNNLFK